YTFDCQGCGPEIDDVKLVRLGGDVYFTANVSNDTFFGPVLYRTDGSAAGTSRLLPAALPPDDSSLLPAGPLTAFGGDLYFLAHGAQLEGPGSPGIGLFRGLDQPALLRRLVDTEDLDFQLTPVGGRLFFRAADPAHGIE